MKVLLVLSVLFWWRPAALAFAAPQVFHLRPPSSPYTNLSSVRPREFPSRKQQLSTTGSATRLFSFRAAVASSRPIDKLVWLTAAIRGGTSDDVLAAEAFDWCSNLGAPAALVAGAVLATLSSTRNELTPRETDAPGVQWRKKICRFLLLSAFALEVFCIFVTTVTGASDEPHQL